MDINDFLITTAQHLATQRERCVNDAEMCLYEDESGNHCAIGVHLTPELCAKLDSFNFSARQLAKVARSPLRDSDDVEVRNMAAAAERFMSALNGLDGELLDEVQSIHDRTKERTVIERKAMLQKLRRLALQHGAARAHVAICNMECPEFL